MCPDMLISDPCSGPLTSAQLFGNMHEKWAERLFSLRNPSLRVLRGMSKVNLSGYVGFFQVPANWSTSMAPECLRHQKLAALSLQLRPQ
jgi:hypothetical protein